MSQRTIRFSRWSAGALAATTLVCAATAGAADNGIYIGGSALEASADYDAQLAPFNAPSEDSSGFKLIGGIRPLDRLGVEANYVSLGEADFALPVVCPAVVGFPCPDQISLETRAVSVSAVGYFTVPFADIFGRVGVARWATDLTAEGFESTERGTDPTFGAGAQLRLGGFAVRLEYERFKLADDAADAVSVGFTYTFF